MYCTWIIYSQVLSAAQILILEKAEKIWREERRDSVGLERFWDFKNIAWWEGFNATYKYFFLSKPGRNADDSLYFKCIFLYLKQSEQFDAEMV